MQNLRALVKRNSPDHYEYYRWERVDVAGLDRWVHTDATVRTNAIY